MMHDALPPTEYDPTDLCEAIEAGDEESVRRILRAAPVLAKPDRGAAEEDPSPLHVACIEGLVGIADALLDAGADPSGFWIVGADGEDLSVWTPLDLAMKHGSDPDGCAELLIARGAPLSIDGPVTQLHLAAYEQDFRLAVALLVRGARCDVFVAAGLGLLHEVRAHLASSPGLSRVRLRGGEGIPRDLPFGRGETALHWAARACSAAITPLCRAGADLNAVSDRGETPLHWAVDGGAAESVRELLELGATPELRSNDGTTPLKMVQTVIEETDDSDNRRQWEDIAEMLRQYGKR